MPAEGVADKKNNHFHSSWTLVIEEAGIRWGAEHRRWCKSLYLNSSFPGHFSTTDKVLFLLDRQNTGDAGGPRHKAKLKSASSKEKPHSRGNLTHTKLSPPARL